MPDEPQKDGRPRPRERTRKALLRKRALVETYIAQGMTQAEAETRAQSEMRDNPKGDWRRG